MAEQTYTKESIEYTKKAFEGPTPRQLELQAQARARGGLTSRGVRDFESKSPEEQQDIIQEERQAVGLAPEGPSKTIVRQASRDMEGKTRLDRAIEQNKQERSRIVTQSQQSQERTFPGLQGDQLSAPQQTPIISSRQDVFPGLRGESLPEQARIRKPEEQKKPYYVELAGGLIKVPRFRGFTREQREEINKEFEEAPELQFTVPAIFTPSGVKGAARTVLSNTPRVVQAIGKTKTGRFVAGLVGTEVATQAAGKATEFGFDVTTDKEIKEVLTPELKEGALRAGFEAEREALQDSSFVRKAGYGLTILAGNKEEFSTGAEEYLRQQGLTGERLETAKEGISRSRTARATREVVENLGLSAGAELTGRSIFRVITRELGDAGKVVAKKKAGLFLSGQSLKALLPAGFVEGSLQELSQQNIREQDRNFKSILGMGLLGSGTAGLIGAPIVGTSVNKAKTSKTISFLANIIDPFEWPGDVTATGLEKGAGKLLKREFKQAGGFVGPKIIPPATVPIESLFFSNNVQTQTDTKQKRKRKRGLISNIFTDTLDIPGPKEDQITNIFDETPPQTDPNIETTIDNIIGENEPEPEITPDTGQKEETTTNTFSQINSFISFPTTTPLLRIPPPLALGGPGTGRGAGSARGKGSIFFNELAFLGPGVNFLNPQPRRATSSKSKKTTKRRNNTNILGGIL